LRRIKRGRALLQCGYSGQRQHQVRLLSGLDSPWTAAPSTPARPHTAPFAVSAGLWICGRVSPGTASTCSPVGEWTPSPTDGYHSRDDRNSSRCARLRRLWPQRPAPASKLPKRHRRTVPFRLLKTSEGDRTPLYDRPFKCRECGSREVATLYAVETQAELDELGRELSPPRPTLPHSTHRPRHPDADLL
jgi:hypothetical protein